MHALSLITCWLTDIVENSPCDAHLKAGSKVALVELICLNTEK